MRNSKLFFKNRKVAVLGAGVEGLSLAKFLYKHGANVTICDQKEIINMSRFHLDKFKWRLGANYLENLSDFEIIFRSPGIPVLRKEIQKIKQKGVEISSQIKLFFELCPCKIIGVTGTKGKGTTATLIYEILKSSISDKRSSVYLAGNIGTPAIELIRKLKPQDTVVLELSSFQLQDLEKSPNIAVVLNVTQDHLDYHKDRNEYINAKIPITKFQTSKDFLVVNVDYETPRSFREHTTAQIFEFSRFGKVSRGCFVKDGLIVWKDKDREIPIVKTSDLTLRGEHNWENICAAAAASILKGAKPEKIGKIIAGFPGLEHRLEFVSEIDGVKYYNDSFSTTPETAIAALRAFKEPKILILGGSDKGSDYKELGKEIARSNVKAVILIGEMAQRIKNSIIDYRLSIIDRIKIIEGCRNMHEIVKAARFASKPGDVVLLSPACASFGMFKNYKDRGEQFKLAVKNLYGVSN
jgi:UDP-N-acetylmuramoylalanine--D-glutamate ligase